MSRGKSSTRQWTEKTSSRPARGGPLGVPPFSAGTGTYHFRSARVAERRLPIVLE